MTAGSPDRAPVLVLGLGNLLLADDAAGLRLLEQLAKESLDGGTADYVDGGTQGLALVGELDGRGAVLILDAVGLGAAPGTVHVLRDEQIEGLRARRSSSAHEGNALELLEAARLIGCLPRHVVVVGIEPAAVHTGIGLSPAVDAAIPTALAAARKILESLQDVID